MLMSLLPFVLIFVIMYFLILRPQQKRVKHASGDGQESCAAATPSSPPAGLIGKVTKVVDDEQIEVEIRRRACACARCGR